MMYYSEAISLKKSLKLSLSFRYQKSLYHTMIDGVDSLIIFQFIIVIVDITPGFDQFVELGITVIWTEIYNKARNEQKQISDRIYDELYYLLIAASHQLFYLLYNCNVLW